MQTTTKIFVILVFLLSTAIYADQPSAYTEKNLNVSVQSSHPQFEIKLHSNATTGYSWFLRKYNSQLLEPVKHVYQAPESKKGLVGAPGYEIWTFRMKPASFVVPQKTTIRFVYARPWESAGTSETQLVFNVTTRKS